MCKHLCILHSQSHSLSRRHAGAGTQTHRNAGTPACGHAHIHTRVLSLKGFEGNYSKKASEMEELMKTLYVNVSFSNADVEFMDQLKLVENNLREYKESAVINEDFVK